MTDGFHQSGARLAVHGRRPFCRHFTAPTGSFWRGVPFAVGTTALLGPILAFVVIVIGGIGSIRAPLA